MSMTQDEAILLSAYTGFLLVPDFSEVHKFYEDALGRPIFTHEFADRDVQKEIQEKLRPQIMELIQNTTALRGPTREQVEKVFHGCEMCREKKRVKSDNFCGAATMRIVGDSIDLRGDEKKIKFFGHIYAPSFSVKFCPFCGKPLAPEAVDMMLERWKEAAENA